MPRFMVKKYTMFLTLLVVYLLLPKSILTFYIAPNFGNGVNEPLEPSSDSSDSYLENDMEVISLKKNLNVQNVPIKKENISSNNIARNSIDYEKCVEHDGRILCGYEKNKGLQELGRIIDLGNGCRIRGDRMECGYDNKNKPPEQSNSPAIRQRPTRTRKSGISNRDNKISSDMLENKLLKSTFDNLLPKSVARQNVSKPVVLIEPTITAKVSTKQISSNTEKVISSTPKMTQSTETVTQNTDTVTQNTDAAPKSNDIFTQSNATVNQYTKRVTQKTDRITQRNETVTQNTDTVTQNTGAASKSNEFFTQSNATVHQNTERLTQKTERVTQSNDTVTQSNATVTHSTESVTLTTELITQSNNTVTRSNATVPQSVQSVTPSTKLLTQRANKPNTETSTTYTENMFAKIYEGSGPNEIPSDSKIFKRAIPKITITTKVFPILRSNLTESEPLAVTKKYENSTESMNIQKSNSENVTTACVENGKTVGSDRQSVLVLLRTTQR